MVKKRADILLLEQGLADTEQKARALILAGRVRIKQTRIEKAGQLISSEATLQVQESGLPFASRGGIKLAGALDYFGIDVQGAICLDIGASSGGFTDCLLQRGARLVMALDVGKGQLNWRIAQDPRVIRLEGINARYLRNEWLPQIPQLVTIDISFISLAKVLPAVTRALTSIERPVPMQLLALVKPQFELPQARVEPGGVVADAASRQEAVDAICHTLTELGWAIRGTMESLLTGAEGNRETFILCVFPVHSF